MIYNCSLCNYFTERKYNFIRHNANKHTKEYENMKNIENVQNVCPNEQNVCPMCYKTYKTKRHLNKHKSLCKGIDELTCSKCMISFTTRSAKHKHIKRNNCSARSVIHYHNKNIQNIIQNQNIYNTTNNTNNLIINNFGSERIDHISQDDIVKMLTSGLNTIPLYIEKKHFDKEFPENNNITFTNENKCKVMENNKWKERDISTLSSKLIQDNSEVLLLYCDDNEMNLLNVLQDEEKFKFIKHKLFIVYDKSESQKYNEILSKIKDLIKNSKL